METLASSRFLPPSFTQPCPAAMSFNPLYILIWFSEIKFEMSRKRSKAAADDFQGFNVDDMDVDYQNELLGTYETNVSDESDGAFVQDSSSSDETDDSDFNEPLAGVRAKYQRLQEVGNPPARWRNVSIN